MTASRRLFLKTMMSIGAALALGPIGCTTQPQRSSRGPLRLLFYTDVHASTKQSVPIAMDRAVTAINNQNADLIINGGDLIHQGFHATEHDAAANWDVYMAMHHAIVGDIYSTIGNHDLVGVRPKNGSSPSVDPRAAFRTRLGLERTYYAFEAHGYLILVLDSVYLDDAASEYIGFIEPEQMAWIKAKLANIARSKPIIVVTHIPLLSSLYSATRGATAPVPPELVIVNNVDVLDAFKHHNLVLVLQGHLHVNELIRWRNTTFITGGAICGRWWRGSRFGTDPGFGIATLDGNNVTWEYIDYGWQVKASVPQNV